MLFDIYLCKVDILEIYCFTCNNIIYLEFSYSCRTLCKFDEEL